MVTRRNRFRIDPLPPLIMRLLRFRHKLPPDFPLQEEIDRFRNFQNKVKVAPLPFDSRLQAFANERRWTKNERTNFRIKSAIKNGMDTIENLITKKDAKGKQIFEYECCNCGSIDKRGIPRRLFQFLYDKLDEDEALKSLLNTEMRKCPECGEHAEFRKLMAKRNDWQWVQFLTELEMIRNSESGRKIVFTPEQFAEHCKASDDLSDQTFKIGNALVFGSEGGNEKELKLYIKPYVQRYYNSFPHPHKRELCSRPDCLEPIPIGSRTHRKYCSEECRSYEKTRRSRLK